MKPYFLLLLLVSWAGRAQQLMNPLPVDAATGLVTYMAVVPTPGVIQANLLARAKVWASRVEVGGKPTVIVSELGTDVLVVAGAQAINSKYDVQPQRLLFLVRIALREGRYQYHFDEYTFEVGSSTGPPGYEPVERTFLGNAPPKATGNSVNTRLRRAFDEATGQAAATLQAALTTPLTAGDW